MALVPSLKSAVLRSQSCSSYSRSVAWATASARPRRSVSRVEMIASGADWAISVAISTALVRHLVLRDAVIHQTNRQCFLAGQAASGVHHHGGVLPADQAGQGGGQAEAGVKAKAGEVGGEPGLGAGDTEIRHDRKADARADGGAMHGGDDRLAVLRHSRWASL